MIGLLVPFNFPIVRATIPRYRETIHVGNEQVGARNKRAAIGYEALQNDFANPSQFHATRTEAPFRDHYNYFVAR